MDKLKSIENINTNSIEGLLLLVAIGIIETHIHSEKTPDQILEILGEALEDIAASALLNKKEKLHAN